MTPNPPDGDAEDRSERFLRKAVNRPGETRADLPEVVGLLAAERRETRMNAAWAVGLVVRAHPETIPHLIPRLVPLLRDEQRGHETARVLAYIADQFRDLTRTAIKEQYPVDHAGVSRFLSQLDDPDATVTPGDAAVLELLSKDRQDRARSGRGDPDSPDGDAGQLTGNGAPRQSKNYSDRWESEATLDRRERTVIDGIERASDRLGSLEHRRRVTGGPAVDVYKAIASGGTTDRGVVLKVLRDGTPGPEFLGGFRDALERWEHVAWHDSVCSLLDAGCRPRPWFATECLEAGTLPDRDDDPLAAKAAVAGTLLETVAYAHGRGVIHGELIPRNVLFTHPIDSRRPVPKITDWAVDHVIARPLTGGRRSPAHAAPEQVGDEPRSAVDQYTDCYQLGACLYRLFTGREPFAGAPDAVRAAVHETAPPPPSDVNPALPTDLDEVLGTAMAKHKASRYETAARFRSALDGVFR